MPPQPNIPNNSEIEKALEEFGKDNQNQEHIISAVITPKTNQSPTKQVEGVSFDIDKDVETYKAIKIYNEIKPPKMVKAVMKYSKGNQRQAEWILLGFVIVAMGFSAYLFFGGVFENPKPKTDWNSIEVFHSLK